MKKENFNVNGMSCAHCEGRVNTAVGALNGVKAVKASAKKNEVTVKYDEGTVDTQAIVAEIVKAGYEVI